MGGTNCWWFPNNSGVNRSGAVDITPWGKERMKVTFPPTRMSASEYTKNLKRRSKLFHQEQSKSLGDENNIRERTNTTRDQTNKTNGNTLGMHKFETNSDINCSHLDVYDDWRHISDPKSEAKIKSLTIYANYYICGIEIVYILADLREITSAHNIEPTLIDLRQENEKVTLELDDDEYIHYISYWASSQKKYIRSLQVGTTGGKLMVIEGQVELNSLNSNTNSSFTNLGLYKPRPTLETTPYESNKSSHLLTHKSARGRIYKSENENLSWEFYKFNIKKLRNMSVLQPDEKIYDVDLQKKDMRMVGLKTEFGKYLRSIELYTEPCHYPEDN